MTAILNQDFVTYVGDDVFPIFTVYDSTLVTVVDISTVSEIVWQAIRNSDSAVALTKKKSLAQIAFVTTGADGKFQVTIAKTDTAGLTGSYRHTATITDAFGNVTTVEVGNMRVGVKPAWTYDAQSIATEPLYQARRMLGDVDKDNPQLSDEEIRFFISQRSSVFGAVADMARALQATYSRQADTTSPGGLSTRYSTRAKAYGELAATMDSIARSRGAGISPFAGGISIADKVNRQQDTDRVQPSFGIGMQDNLTLPVGPTGIETPTQPMGNGTTGLGS